MSKPDFFPVQKAEPLEVRQTDADDRQFWVEGMSDGRSWDERYVGFSGYFGAYGPHVFSAAPDLLSAAKAALFVLSLVYQREPGTNEAGAIAGLSAAINKAEGR